MAWPNTFIAVDWGTTNRRAWRLKAGAIAREFEDGRGILSVESGEFPAAVAEIREQLGDLPMLMAGMIGSSRGWKEARYVSCPAGLDELAACLTWPESGLTAIVPGLACQDPPDVMRGEEVQILGAVEEDVIPRDSFVCHPGTHNKWVTVASGRVVGFRTVMTGEMFGLLRERGILRDMLTGEVSDGRPFREGVAQGLEGSVLTAEFFSVRAKVLLGQLREEDAAAFTSGLLIGADLRFGLEQAIGGKIFVMGRPELTSLYAAALEVAGRPSTQIDGETAFLAGIKAIAKRL